MPEKKHTGTTVKAKGIICMTNLDCMWGLVIAPPEASGCAEQQKVGDAWASSGLHSQCTNISTLRRKWKQEGGGAERGWGIYRQFIYAEHQPTAHCLKDKGSECFMPDGKQRQQFKTICIQHMHPLPSTSPFLCPDWYWNIIHLERRHVIIFLSGLFLSLSRHSGQFQVVAGWNVLLQQVGRKAERLHFDSV